MVNFGTAAYPKPCPDWKISEIAVIDVDKNTAFHLEAIQTPGDLPGDESRIDWYARLIVERAAKLKEFADYLVYDGAAAKMKFVDPILEKDEMTIYSAVVNSPSLKRNLKIAYVKDTKSDDYVMLFSTDVTLDGLLMYRYDKARFQIEFLIRDSKRYTGLMHCQARSEKKLAFHFNTSLTSVSLAKSEFYANPDKHAHPFSMHDIMTRHFNTIFLDQVFSKRSIDPADPQIAETYQELINFGTITA